MAPSYVRYPIYINNIPSPIYIIKLIKVHKYENRTSVVIGQLRERIKALETLLHYPCFIIHFHQTHFYLNPLYEHNNNSITHTYTHSHHSPIYISIISPHPFHIREKEKER